jgi:hypothetical protein
MLLQTIISKLNFNILFLLLLKYTSPLTCELNLILQPETMQGYENFPPCIGTCFSSHDIEHDAML